MKRTAIFICALLGVSSGVSADQVVMMDGTILNGEIVSESDSIIILETPNRKIGINRSDTKEIRVKESDHVKVTLKNGSVLEGYISFQDADKILLRMILRVVQIKKSDIQKIETFQRTSGRLSFEAAGPFSEGLAAIAIGGRYGYIDKTIRIVISPQFAYATHFSEGLAPVKTDGQYGYINTSGAFVIPPQFDGAGSFSEGMAAVKIGGKAGYIDRNGNLVIPHRFHEAFAFSETLARVCNASEPLAYLGFGRKCGYINRAGEEIIKQRFVDAGDFSEGLAPVKLEKGKFVGWYYINQKGKKALKTTFKRAESFSEGLAAAEEAFFIAVHPGHLDNSLIFIDPHGNTVLRLRGRSSEGIRFSEGLAAVNAGTDFIPRYGYIDRTGRFIISPQFDMAGHFSEGLALVKIKIGWYYINKAGELLW